MRFVSLFAGVGGFDLAFERAGMTCVGQVEIDARCREVLATHWPDVPRFEDVHEISGDDIGTTDVLCGGFPCQDYSVAGKRGGLAGDRGALWWQFHRLIAECRPRWVVGENVPGLLSSNGGKDFGAIVGSLVELGYGVVWRVLDAQYFGVAQRRRRVFIVGHLGGIPRPEILAFAEGCAGDTPPRREEGQRVAALTANGLGGGGPDDNLAQAGHLIAKSVLTKTGNRNDPFTETLIPSYLPEPALRQTDHKAPKIDIAEPSLIAFAQNTRDEVRDLHNLAGALVAQPGKQTTYLAAFLENQDGELYEAPTVQIHAGGGKPGQGYPAIREGSSVRRLTPLECERLQGFPDNWTAGQSDTQRYRQMGNAVAVPVAEWIGKRLAAA